MHFIDLQAQYQHLKQRIDNRIQTVLDHGKYISGPEVKELEERLSSQEIYAKVDLLEEATNAYQDARSNLDEATLVWESLVQMIEDNS